MRLSFWGIALMLGMLFCLPASVEACDNASVRLLAVNGYCQQPANVLLLQQRVFDVGGGNNINIVNAGRGRGANVIQASAGGGGGASVNIVNQRSGLFGLRQTQVIQASAGR